MEDLNLCTENIENIITMICDMVKLIEETSHSSSMFADYLISLKQCHAQLRDHKCTIEQIISDHNITRLSESLYQLSSTFSKVNSVGCCITNIIRQ